MEETSTQANLHHSALECSICLAPPMNPVVTSCGHLFCWPCLYSWLQDQAKPCPVCRVMVRKDFNVTPIYGSHEEESKEAGHSGDAIPPRPNPPSSSLAVRRDRGSDRVITMNATADQILQGSIQTVSTLLERNDRNERARGELQLGLEAARAHVNALRGEQRRLRATVADFARLNHQLEVREQAWRQRAHLNSMRVHYAPHQLL